MANIFRFILNARDKNQVINMSGYSDRDISAQSLLSSSLPTVRFVAATFAELIDLSRLICKQSDAMLINYLHDGSKWIVRNYKLFAFSASYCDCIG